jgi:hypothetical protein
MVGNRRRAKRDPASDPFDRGLSHRQDEDETEDATEAESPTEQATGAAGPERIAVTDDDQPARAAAPPAGASTNVEFTPRTKARSLLGWLLLIAVLGAGVAGYAAYSDPTTLTVGLAGTLTMLVLVLWAIRTGSPSAHLRVHAGQLEVVQGGVRNVFELTGSFTPIEVVGTPGDRDWRVLFLRRNMDPFVIDSSMVDPREFMEVLRRYRPE